MRQTLIDLIKRSICFKYSLPNGIIESSVISTQKDDCYECYDDNEITKIIYNALIDYSYNEYELDEANYQNLFTKALITKLHYTNDSAKLQKLGFYGEILLYVMLRIFYNSNAAISRGYFYHILENGETKGFDSYHFIENNGIPELWFGEAKFYQNMNSAIKTVLDKISISLSNNYLSENIIALNEHKNDFNLEGTIIQKIVLKWDDNPNINIIEELKSCNGKLIYPIFIVGQIDTDYDTTIKKAINYIKEYTIPEYSLDIDVSIFFIFLPVINTAKIKEDVVSWIETKKPLI